MIQVFRNQPGIYPNGDVIRYFGKDIDVAVEKYPEDCKKEYIGKGCYTSDEDYGIIVGFEYNEPMADLYYIIYVPETKETTYELSYDKSFITSIEK